MADDVSVVISGWGQGSTLRCGSRVTGTLLVTNNTTQSLAVRASQIRLMMVVEGPVRNYDPGFRIPSRVTMPLAFELDLPSGLTDGRTEQAVALVELTDGRQFAVYYPVTISCP
jgi:hypothetical protein